MGWPTVDDLSDHLGVVSSGDDDGHAEAAIRAAVAAVKDEARQVLDVVEDEELVLDGVWGPELRLPEVPITDVSSVSVVYQFMAPETLAGFTWTKSGRLFNGMSSWGGPGTQVTVTYTHGWSTPPSVLWSLVLDVAARRFLNPEGIRTDAVGDKSVAVMVPTVALTAQEARTARRFRPPVR